MTCNGNHALRYDYLLHATVQASENWGLPFSDDDQEVSGNYDQLAELCRDFRLSRQRSGVSLTAYKRANYVLAHMEAARLEEQCISRPFAVQLSRDERCNLSCVYCRPRRYDSLVSMNREQWVAALSVLLPAALEFLPFCWGEPLLAPEFDLTCCLAEKYQTSLSLITNLQHLTPDLADLFVRHVTRALVSADTADRVLFEKLRCGGDLYTLERHMTMLHETAERIGVTPPWLGISAVMLRSNLTLLPELITWASRRGFRGVYAGRLVIPEHIREFGRDERVDLQSAEYAAVYTECAARARALAVELSMYNPVDPIGVERMCLCPWHHVYVSASGDVCSCNFSRLTVLGKLPLHDSYWNSNAIRRRRSIWTVDHRCQSCQSTDYDGRPGVLQERGY
ncbi:MAG: hypothetical protein HQ567_24720 [Candidatus Nealsonbacteria bacterium]|nr:hypothetical protein [Candidatus Nealsonbacteria bacterium]